MKKIIGICRDCEHYDAPHCKAHCITGIDEDYYCASFCERDDGTVGGRIRKLRAERKETQAKTGKAIGVSRAAFGYYECGTRDIPTRVIIKLSDYFGVTCEYLLRGNGDLGG